MPLLSPLQGENIPESSTTICHTSLTTVYDKLEVHRMITDNHAENTWDHTRNSQPRVSRKKNFRLLFFLTELVAFVLFILFHLFYELHVPLCQPVRFLLLSLTFQLNSQQSLFSLPAAKKKKSLCMNEFGKWVNDLKTTNTLSSGTAELVS